MKKLILPVSISLALVLLFLSTQLYPGGSQKDPNAAGFDWGNNYLCNLFNATGINGGPNPGRFWGIAGMFFLCFGLAWFFYGIGEKITSGRPAKIIRYSGTASMCFAFFVVTPYHDTATTAASILAMLALFYLTVFSFRSRLLLLKVISSLGLLLLYVNNYVYYTQHFLEYLPVLQKLGFLSILSWMVMLEYYATPEDFPKGDS